MVQVRIECGGKEEPTIEKCGWGVKAKGNETQHAARRSQNAIGFHFFSWYALILKNIFKIGKVLQSNYSLTKVSYTKFCVVLICQWFSQQSKYLRRFVPWAEICKNQFFYFVENYTKNVCTLKVWLLMLAAATETTWSFTIITKDQNFLGISRRYLTVHCYPQTIFRKQCPEDSVHRHLGELLPTMLPNATFVAHENFYSHLKTWNVVAFGPFEYHEQPITI